jgi:hypothetical protein
MAKNTSLLEVDDRANRLALVHQLERLVDALERKLVSVASV